MVRVQIIDPILDFDEQITAIGIERFLLLRKKIVII